MAVTPPRYATVSDLGVLSLPPAALIAISDEDKQANLDAASSLADSYLRSTYKLPLVSWGSDLTANVCAIGAFKLMAHRGYNPQTGANETIRLMYEDAIRWLELVSDERVHPTVEESPPAAHPRALVSTKPPRGWDRMP